MILLIFAGCRPSAEITIPPTERYLVEVYTLPDFPIERYELAKTQLSWNLNGLMYNNSVRAEWLIEDTFWYSVNTRRGTEYFFVDAANRQKAPLLNQEGLAEALTEHFELENPINPWSLQLSGFSVSDDRSKVTFTFGNKVFEADRQSGSFSILSENPEVVRPNASVLSPDGRHAAFIRGHNLWVMDMETGEERQLTNSGEEHYGFATDSQGWSRSNRPILAWSGDGRLISTYRLDERKVELMHLLRTASPRAELVSWPYALPGDEHVPMHERVVIHLETGKKVWLDAPKDHQRTSNCCGLTRGPYWADNEFSADGKKLAYVSTSRDYKEVTLRVADTETGEVRDVYTERDEIFIETNLTSRGVPNWRVLHGSNEFIWFSRKSDWGHLYLHDLTTGKAKNAITHGEWNVVDILEVDEADRRIYFSAVGINPDFDPYQEYVYSIKFDGSGLRSHTPDEGNNSVTPSPGWNFLINTYSDFQNPPVTVLRDCFGETIMVLEETDFEDLLDAGWQKPQPFTAKARDGETDIYGLMFKPSDFDPTKKYPIINSIYPGPQVGSVGSRSFSPSRRGQMQALAELGFIVVAIDALGTPMRSRGFHTAYYGDMADNGLPDQVAAMEQLAERYPWIDIERAGMYGHSGGGFATTAALFNFPDFFKVGVASAGNLDNRGYTFYWGEKFQGPLVRFDDGTDSFTNQALQLQAENLKGNLLISYGTMDSNVHPDMTLLVINELIRHNKDFDVVVMPNRGHGYANETFHIRKTWDYFVRYLLGKEPPREFDMGR